MLNSFNISLIIRGTIGNPEELTALKKYGKTTFTRKGETISRVVDLAEQDFFAFTYTLTENCEKDLKDFSDLIKNINLTKYKECDVKLRIYIQSLDAFILIMLTQEMLKTLCELGLDVEISILSWGEVPDEPA
ncbi:MAG: hypothetical protein NC253_10625 [Ruminococcus sp.]|nr:hypothetical protein [Ruminococcus sp.]MCM1382039.1 hypothetical protein [Muribaculaceae bacterium]